MSRLRLRLWMTPRWFWLLGAVAAALAFSPGVRLLLPVALVMSAGLGIATLADLWVGPPRQALDVVRGPLASVALRRPCDLLYHVTNRSGQAILLGIAEASARTLSLHDREATGRVGSRSRATLKRRATPVARGRDSFDTLYAWYENRFGLLRRRVVIPAALQWRVFPDLSAVERYGALHLRSHAVDAGLRALRRRGVGREYASLREWTTGDSPRDIDWKATARRGKLMAIEREVERGQNVFIVLDCGRLMTPRVGTLRKLDYAVTAALSLASIASLTSDRVGALAFAGDVLAACAPRPSKSSSGQIGELLYDLEPRFEESDYAGALAAVRRYLRKRSLVVLLSDAAGASAGGAMRSEIGYLARHHLVVCVFMNDMAVESALGSEPQTIDAAYRSAVALELDRERQATVLALERVGVVTIDAPAPTLGVRLIDSYLRVKQRGLI
ncbi:MAG: DUF58 domain-containing protein [Vulcanimicrobiaceae bacterium]